MAFVRAIAAMIEQPAHSCVCVCCYVNIYNKSP